MNALRESVIRLPSPEQEALERPKRLTAGYIKSQAEKDFAIIREANLSIREELSTEKLDAFVDSNVIGYRVNGVDVLLISQDYDNLNGRLRSIPRAFLASPRTSKVGIEYFRPELRRNAKRVPILGPRFIHKREDTMRLVFSGQIEDQAQHVKKSLFCADIADRSSYEMLYTLVPLIPMIASLTLLGSAGFDAIDLISKTLSGPNMSMLIHSFIPEAATEMAKLIFPLAYIQLSSVHMRDESQKKGFFDPNNLNERRQKFGFNLEDARRVFVAAGIQQLTKDLQVPEDISDKKRPQIVMFYPKAHVIRIADYIEHPHKVKRVVYRLVPGMKEKIREYVWDPDSKESKKFGGWRRTANKRISLLT